VQGHSKPLISIVIPTRNSARTLGACLQSVLGQTLRDIEILVIDANSSDLTVDIANQYAAKVVSVDGERTTAKNTGVKLSKGEYVLFIDSDMILEPCVVEKCVQVCSSNDVAGVIIPERSIGKGFWIRVRDFERSLYLCSEIESARFFKKDFVIRAGGFDEDIVFYEESTLPQKIKQIGGIVDERIDSFILHDENGFHLQKWLQKKRYYADSVKPYSLRYTTYARTQISVKYRLKIMVGGGKWKRLLSHPLLTIGLFTLKTLEFFYSGGLAGFTTKN